MKVKAYAYLIHFYGRLRDLLICSPISTPTCVSTSKNSYYKIQIFHSNIFKNIMLLKSTQNT